MPYLHVIDEEFEFVEAVRSSLQVPIRRILLSIDSQAYILEIAHR